MTDADLSAEHRNGTGNGADGDSDGDGGGDGGTSGAGGPGDNETGNGDGGGDEEEEVTLMAVPGSSVSAGRAPPVTSLTEPEVAQIRAVDARCLDDGVADALTRILKGAKELNEASQHPYDSGRHCLIDGLTTC